MDKKQLVAASIAALALATSQAASPTVAFFWPTPSTSDHRQGVFTGVRLTGDARKHCTMELWIRPRSNSLSTHLVEQYSGADGRTNFTRAGDGHIGVWMGGYTGASMSSVGTVALNEWAHVAWVIDGDTWRFYINGELDSETTGHASHLMCENPDGMVIGNSWKSNYNGNSAANFAEVRVWTCVRTGAEIKAWMDKRIPNAWQIENLVGYWPLDDGDTAYNAAGGMVRNCAVPGAAGFVHALDGRFYAGEGSYVAWSVPDGADALPVSGSTDGDQTALYNLGIHHDVASDVGDWTNAVDTAVTATPANFTFMGWYFVSASTPGRINNLFGKMKAANGRATFGENNGNLSLWMGGGLGGGKTNESLTASAAMPLKRWAHVALIKRGGTVQIYVNGTLKAQSDAFTLDLCDANLQVGGYQTSNAWGGFYGAFKNIGFWSKAMDAETIRKYMTAMPSADDPKLLGYWPMDDGAGNTARNLKTGASPATPLGGGFFYWTKGPNMPAVDGTVQPPAFVMSIR